LPALIAPLRLLKSIDVSGGRLETTTRSITSTPTVEPWKINDF